MDINVTTVVKGREKYVFVWRDEQRLKMLLAGGRYALDHRLSFDVHDLWKLVEETRSEHMQTIPVSDIEQAVNRELHATLDPQGNWTLPSQVVGLEAPSILPVIRGMLEIATAALAWEAVLLSACKVDGGYRCEYEVMP